MMPKVPFGLNWSKPFDQTQGELFTPHHFRSIVFRVDWHCDKPSTLKKVRSPCIPQNPQTRMDSFSKTLHWRDRAHRFEPHFHTQFFIGVILHGECHFLCGGTAHVARAGDLVLIPPFEVHSAKCGIGTQYRAMYISESLLDLLTPQWHSGPGKYWHSDVVVSNSPFAPSLVEALDAKDIEAIRLIVGAILDCYTRPPQSISLSPALGQHILRVMREAVEKRLPIADVATNLHLSAESFSRSFHKSFGMRAVFFRNQLRLRKAEDQLFFGTAASIVAAESGYADQAHFIRELKKFRGVTPNRYVDCYRPLIKEMGTVQSAKIFKTNF